MNAPSPVSESSGAARLRRAAAQRPAAPAQLQERRDQAHRHQHQPHRLHRGADPGQHPRQHPATAFERIDAAGGKRQHQSLGVHHREHHRAREDDEQDRRPARRGAVPPALGQAVDEDGRDQAAGTRDERTGDRGAPDRVVVEHQEHRLLERPHGEREQGEEAEGRLGVADVVGVAVVGQLPVPQPVPVGELVQEVVVAEGAVQVGHQQQHPARRHVHDGDPQDLLTGGHGHAGTGPDAGCRPQPHGLLDDRRRARSKFQVRETRVGLDGHPRVARLISKQSPRRASLGTRR